jgi:hypothetical protein
VTCGVISALVAGGERSGPEAVNPARLTALRGRGGTQGLFGFIRAF